MRKILDLLVVFVDVLQKIKVNINVISRRNLDTVRNIDKFCQFGYTYVSNIDLFLVFIFALIYRTILFGFVSKCNADRSQCFGYQQSISATNQISHSHFGRNPKPFRPQEIKSDFECNII